MPSADQQQAEKGHLYLVATPIGNLLDLSERARLILDTVDLVACEDTRVSGQLLSRLDIEASKLSYRDANEKELSPQLVERLKAGESIALIADAGTPNLSDPGFRLVAACRREGLPVVPVPGPCAAIAALTVSGLPTHKFLYLGFPPPKSGGRRKLLETHQAFDGSLVLYESCHRIDKFLADASEVLGPDRLVCVARELTKRFESIYTARLEELCGRFEGKAGKGEFVLVIAPKDYTL